MRGKVNGCIGYFFRIRITPAYAGKSVYRYFLPLLHKDHPRVCGEKVFVPAFVVFVSGSPPRMRGKEQCMFFCPVTERITPAYAGKSSPYVNNFKSPWDHPRVCGEKVFIVGTFSAHSGSPPRMRGKDCSLITSTSCYRITPAYAGKSIITTFKNMRVQDHPRVCGEKVNANFNMKRERGSPPRMQGKDVSLKRILFSIRITPAYAGKR